MVCAKQTARTNEITNRTKMALGGSEVRLVRIYWKPTATTEDRRACGAYLRARGLLPIPVICGGGYVWAIKRNVDANGSAR